MEAADHESAIVSDLADLDRVRLADLHVMTDETTSRMLRRIVPAAPGQGVSVAAFNSCV
jgi:FXSXX-COOH protein